MLIYFNSFRSPSLQNNSVSRHHGSPIEGPPNHPYITALYRTEGFKGGPQFSPNMPRDGSFSDSKDETFESSGSDDLFDPVDGNKCFCE